MSTPLCDPLTRAVATGVSDPLTRGRTLKIENLLGSLRSEAWAVLLRDWDRSLRAGNHPETTRYNYVLAASQLAAYLDERMPEAGGAWDPALVDSRQVVAFQASVVESCSAGTGLNKHKALQQFFRWLVAEGEVERSPMSEVPQPKAVQELVEVLSDEETRRILQVCEGLGFVQLRDQALVRMFYNTGGRLSEIGDLLVSDVDLDTDSVVLTGKGGKQRRVRFGAKTAAALRRYVRARSRRPGLEGIDQLWIAAKGVRPLKPNGIKIRLRVLGERAGVEHVHAQRWRHSFAHEWKLAGGDTGDLMLLMGWSSEEMPRRYGASAAAERAQAVHARLGIGERAGSASASASVSEAACVRRVTPTRGVRAATAYVSAVARGTTSPRSIHLREAVEVRRRGRPPREAP